MKDNPKNDAVIKLLDAGGITREDLHSAPVEQLINLRNLLYHWHTLADMEIGKRVESTRRPTLPHPRAARRAFCR